MNSQQLQALNTQLAADPEWQRLVQQFKSSGTKYGGGDRSSYGRALVPFSQYLQSKGLALPSTVMFDPSTGALTDSWTNSLAGTAGLSAAEFGGLAAGGYGAATALGAGGAAAPAVSTVGPLAGGYGVPAAAGAAAVPASLAAPAGALIGPSLLSHIATPLITTGIEAAAGIYGANKAASANTAAAQAGSAAAVQAAQIQADAATKAAQLASDSNREAANAQLKAAEDALSFQKAVYAQKQAQVAPYIGIGQGALSSLSQGLGVRSVPQPPPAMPPSAPTATGIPTYTIDQPSGATPAANGSTLLALSSPLGLSPSAAPPQTATGTGRAAQVGEQRMINGAPATWDGRGWKATPQAATATGAA